MSRAATVTLLLLCLVACGEDTDTAPDEIDMGSADAGTDTVEDAPPEEDATLPDVVEDVVPDVDDRFPYVAPGRIEVTVPSVAAGDEGIAVLIRHPASTGRRYEAGAPVMVIVPDGFGPGNFERNPIATRIASFGFVVVEGLLPGAEGLARSSGGTFDYRGADSAQVLADILGFAAGETQDVDGNSLQDHLAFAGTTNIGLHTKGNGANLAIVTLAEHAETLPPVHWLLAWESPVGDQYAALELNSNPYYDPGTCGLTSCPWPGIEDALRFDYTGMTRAFDLESAVGPRDGVFFLDGDDDGIADDTEFGFRKMVAGPSPDGQEILLHPSIELRATIQGVRDELFDDRPDPSWLASVPETEAFWSLRDGAPRIPEASRGFPDLMVMHLGTLFDEKQTASDYPHARSHVNSWLQANHGWVRMNADASYMEHVTGEPAEGYVDNRANRLIPSEGANAWVELEMIGAARTDEFIGYAGMLELADRVQAGNREADLDRVLYQDP